MRVQLTLTIYEGHNVFSHPLDGCQITKVLRAAHRTYTMLQEGCVHSAERMTVDNARCWQTLRHMGYK